MPVTKENLIPIQREDRFQVSLEPAFNIFSSLTLLIKAGNVSGFNEWVYRTLANMSDQLKWNHRLAFEGLHYALVPDRSFPSFPDYIRHIAALDPLILRDKLFDTYLRIDYRQMDVCHCFKDTPDEMDPENVLGSADEYITFLEDRFGPGQADMELEKEAYKLVSNPPSMQKFAVAHLWRIWDEVMAEEWERVKPMLNGAVQAFQSLDLQGKSSLEAAKLVLDIDLENGQEKLRTKLENAQKITFIPSAHIGPYQNDFGLGGTKWLVFGVRLPSSVHTAPPELKRTEMLVRLNALADETRLKILQLIAAAGAMTSSEIMTHLDLSQSAASRHLMQLSATGYLTENRVQGAKQYSLNPQRIEETLQAISAFLLNK